MSNTDCELEYKIRDLEESVREAKKDQALGIGLCVLDCAAGIWGTGVTGYLVYSYFTSPDFTITTGIAVGIAALVSSIIMDGVLYCELAENFEILKTAQYWRKRFETDLTILYPRLNKKNNHEPVGNDPSDSSMYLDELQTRKK
jgi:hypothetical protein